MWDALLHADQDYDLVFGRRIGVPTVAYFLSRYVSLSCTRGRLATQHYVG